jgi:hypothetical protein
MCPFIGCDYRDKPMTYCRDLDRHIQLKHEYFVNRPSKMGRPKVVTMGKKEGSRRRTWKLKVQQIMKANPLPDCLTPVTKVMNSIPEARLYLAHMVPFAYWNCCHDQLSEESLEALREAKKDENLELEVDSLSNDAEKDILNCLAFAMAYMLSKFSFTSDIDEILKLYSCKVALPSGQIRPSLNWINFTLPGGGDGFLKLDD